MTCSTMSLSDMRALCCYSSPLIATATMLASAAAFRCLPTCTMLIFTKFLSCLLILLPLFKRWLIGFWIHQALGAPYKNLPGDDLGICPT